MAGKARIGTSGWHYKHWVGVFYPSRLPAKDMLAFYAQHFNTVEINNSFYQLPAPATFDSWHASAPKNFLFSVKASRFITHMKKLKEPVRSTRKLFAGMERLKGKLGPVLFQLPPRWSLDRQRLAEFLKSLPKRRRYAFEFRDPSWHVPEVYQLLRHYNAAFCIYDFAGNTAPLEMTASFTYIRFHGSGYSGSYSQSELHTWAERMLEWLKEKQDIYVYFNNDGGGYAVENAKTLQRILDV